MEEIFGEIEDEHDTHDYIAEQTGENEYLFSGRLEISEINEKFHLNLSESDAYDTIAGFILYHHQHFPKLNEIIQIDTILLNV
jgi:CBS domain containing-hemolysin-like protein